MEPSIGGTKAANLNPLNKLLLRIQRPLPSGRYRWECGKCGEQGVILIN
jgi:hypothetical protein